MQVAKNEETNIDTSVMGNNSRNSSNSTGNQTSILLLNSLIVLEIGIVSILLLNI